jgi:hypothetical protein
VRLRAVIVTSLVGGATMAIGKGVGGVVWGWVSSMVGHFI